MCERCGNDSQETPCDGCSMVESARVSRLRDAAPQMLMALNRALDWIARDEEMHGRRFGVGNEVREAIERATGVRPDSNV